MDASQESPAASTANSFDTPRVFVKRPPEDDEPSDLGGTAPKRQAFESSTSQFNGMASLSLRPQYEAAAAATESHLQEKSPADLVSMMHQMQASHAQQISELRDQYHTVCSQLEQLKRLLNAHFTSQLGSLHLLQSNIASISSPKSASQPASQPAIVPPPAPSHSSSAPLRSVSIRTPPSVPSWGTGPASIPAPHYTHATPAPQRQSFGTPLAVTPSPPSFGSSTPPRTSTTTIEMKITPSSVPNEPPSVEPSQIDTVPEVWEEFRYGRTGNVSVEKLDALWGPRWRQDPKLRTWYQRRKVIADRVKLYMADGIGERDAVMEVEKMRRGRTLNWVSRLLLDDRKETRKQRKVAALAATAAKEALHGMPTA